MKKIIAIPTVNGELCAHFGHCEKFALVSIDGENIINTVYIDPPAHEPGLFPKFLAQQGVKLIIASGMGSRAQDIFTANSIDVKVGVASGSPEDVVRTYIKGELSTGSNLCDH